MSGVTYHDRTKSYSGYTLFCESYEDPRATEGGKAPIYLIDMEGTPVHQWEVDTALQSFCRLLPNGDLFYPTRDRSKIEEAGLRRLNAESEVVWSYHCRIDHDYQLLDNGNLLLHTIADHMSPQLGPELKRNPYFLEINRDKELLWEWRGERHLEEIFELLPAKEEDYVRNRIKEQFPFDWAHNNTCQLIPENDTYREELDRGVEPRFKPGNVVFSYRSLDVIGVIERPSGKIVWAWGPAQLDGQHKPHMLENGNLLIFDNGTCRGHSRVIEFDPLEEQIEWEYSTAAKEDFFSPYISGAQRLPNGNTLICEGGKAHLFEVTPEKEVVWNFQLPKEWHKEGGLGSIYRCLRYPKDYLKESDLLS